MSTVQKRPTVIRLQRMTHLVSQNWSTYRIFVNGDDNISELKDEKKVKLECLAFPSYPFP